jgi:hypothetical protein
MRTVDLIDEMARAGSARAALEVLMAAGVPRTAITLPPPLGIAGALGLAPVRVTADGTFEFLESGPLAVVIGVHAPDLDLCDLCAWRPSNPARWRLRLGLADFLGEETADYAAFMGTSLWLYRSPLSWLRAGCAGSVILDWRFGRSLISDVGAIIPEGLAHGEDIERRLRERDPTLPRILIPRLAA